VGVDAVVEGPVAAGATVTRTTFAPPCAGSPDRLANLERFHVPAWVEAVHEANEVALQRFLASEPHLVDVAVARDVIPGMADDLFLHAGPPITWDAMSGPLRGAVIGGMLLEGLAADPDEARARAAADAVRFEPCHAHDAVGPMAGVVTPSMPVWVLEDRGGEARGNRTFATLNEGLGKVLRYGAYDDEVLQRLAFMGDVLGPVLGEALRAHGSIDLKLLMAQALQMGDEGHNRNRAGTSLLIRELAPTLVDLDRPAGEARDVLAFMHANDHFFLNLSMPMAKCMLRAAEGVELSSMLTVMARNGTEFGIQLSCMPGRWFTGPAQFIDGLYFPGFGSDDANPDIGDSAIMETAGIGGFAMAAAPAIVQFVGGTVRDALDTTRAMARLCVGRNPTWAIPTLDFAGAPAGIDLRRVEEFSLLPRINTGIAHKDAGVGQVGAGLVTPPWDCFHHAFDAYFDHCRDRIDGR